MHWPCCCGATITVFVALSQADPSLTAYSRDLITNAAKQLHAAKMAVFDERSGNLFVTELGRVASHFYIRWVGCDCATMCPSVGPQVLERLCLLCIWG